MGTNRTRTNVGPNVYVSNDGAVVKKFEIYDLETGYTVHSFDEDQADLAVWVARRINRNSVIVGSRTVAA